MLIYSVLFFASINTRTLSTIFNVQRTLTKSNKKNVFLTVGNSETATINSESKT